MNELLIPAAITAVVKFIDSVKTKNYDSALKIIVAVVVGLIAGLVGLQSLTPETGVYAGLVAAGVVTVATRIGSK